MQSLNVLKTDFINNKTKFYRRFVYYVTELERVFIVEIWKKLKIFEINLRFLERIYRIWKEMLKNIYNIYEKARSAENFNKIVYFCKKKFILFKLTQKHWNYFRENE